MESKKRSRSYSRTKGHNAEREWAERFRELGFDMCKTSRNASKLLDDCKVDLAFLPLNVQIKKGYDKARPKFDQIFLEMKELLTKHFPKGHEQHSFPRVLIQDIDGYKPERIGVTMTWEDWQIVYKNHLHWITSGARLTEILEQLQVEHDKRTTVD